MNVKDKIPVTLEVGTVAVLLAGLYSVYGYIEPQAIPNSTWIELAEKLVPFFEKWNYDKLTLEEWVQYYLLIYPAPLLDLSEIEEYQENDIYFESDNGNIMLIVTANMGEATF